MSRARLVSIDSKARTVKSVIGFRTVVVASGTGDKGAIQTGKTKPMTEQELDFVVGRSMN